MITTILHLYRTSEGTDTILSIEWMNSILPGVLRSSVTLPFWIRNISERCCIWPSSSKSQRAKVWPRMSGSRLLVPTELLLRRKWTSSLIWQSLGASCSLDFGPDVGVQRVWKNKLTSRKAPPYFETSRVRRKVAKPSSSCPLPLICTSSFLNFAHFQGPLEGPCPPWDLRAPTIMTSVSRIHQTAWI